MKGRLVMHDERPWGAFHVLRLFEVLNPAAGKTETAVVKEIVVKPGNRLSLQKHAKRNEHWFIVQGHGQVTIGDDTRAVAVGDSVDIPVGQTHRVENDDNFLDLIFIEITGGEFDEDDITRFEDDFGRV